MKKLLLVLAALFILMFFNPSIEAHKEALRPHVDASFEKAASESWLSRFGLWLGGEELKNAFYSSLYIKSYGVCSLGYYEDHLVTFGILGFVHVIE